MRKIVSFSLFNRIFENELTYEELVPEFPEYNSILSLFLNTSTAILTRARGVDRNELSNLIDDIESAPLDGKSKAMTRVFDTIIKSLDPKLDPSIKNKINEIYTEIKKVEPILSDLIRQEEEIEGKQKVSDFISKWCEKSKEVILKPEQVKESLKIFESIKLDPRSMSNVFSEDISKLLTQANAVKTDIDTLYNNPTSIRLKRAIEPYKRKIQSVVDELQSGRGQGINWDTINRSQAKERLSFIQNYINEIISEYTKINFKETSYGDKIGPIMSKVAAITDRIGILLSELLAAEEEIEREEILANSAKESDLDWFIRGELNEIVGFRKGRWYTRSSQSDDFNPISFTRFGPGELLKGDNSTYKIENSEWYFSDDDSIDNDSGDWTEIEDENTIKSLNNAYAYKLMREAEWCIDNEKPLFNKDGQYVPSEEEAAKFIATPAESKNFDPMSTWKRLKSKKGYDKFEMSDYESGSEESDSNQSGSESQNGQQEDNTPLYLSDDLPRLTFNIKEKIYTNNNSERSWKKDGKDLTTTWFTPGTFASPKESTSEAKLSNFWVRLLKGYWELSDSEDGKKKPVRAKNESEKIKEEGDSEKINNFKVIISSLDNQLEGVLKNTTDLSKYWGIGNGKTDIKEDAWGSEREARAIVKGKDTKDERIEVEIWPDKLGGSSSSDDVILKVYKNGGVGISDDDFSDNIWGDWRVDDDGKIFIVEWKMYSKGDSSYDKGWKSISSYSGGKIGAVTKFSGPIGGGLKPVLDQAMQRFIAVFY